MCRSCDGNLDQCCQYIVTHTDTAFAALNRLSGVKEHPVSLTAAGGDSTSVTSQPESGVVTIYSKTVAFVALKSDGGVVTWGDATKGGDSSLVATEFEKICDGP